MTSGISDLLGLFHSALTSSSNLRTHLVLKTTESSFSNFIRDEYTTLVEVDDRIFSTAVDLSYSFSPVSIPAPDDDKKLNFVPPALSGSNDLIGSVWDGNGVADRARTATLDIFASDDSASVQVSVRSRRDWQPLNEVLITFGRLRFTRWRNE